MIGKNVHKSFALEAPEQRIDFRLGSGGTRACVKKSHLAEKVATAERRENNVDRALYVFTNHHLARFDEVKRIGIV